MPSRVKGPHHRGRYHVLSRALVAAAYADPTTICQARTPNGGTCGKTLAQHPPTRTGKPPRWSAGHAIAGQVDGPLRPEVLSCNSSHGAAIGNRSPKRKHGRTWRPPLPTFRTSQDW